VIAKTTRTDRPAYREIPLVTDKITTALSKTTIQMAAEKQLVSDGNPELKNLIDRLIKANKHELYESTGGSIKVDLSSGIVTTALGVVTIETINKARTLLDRLATFVKNHDMDSVSFVDTLNSYLMLIPQTVHHSRGWHKTFFAGSKSLERQSTLLDQLESSVELAEAKMKLSSQSSLPNLFNADIKVVTDDGVIDKIKKMFYATIKNAHVSKQLKPVKIYEVTLHDMKDKFEKDGAKLPNVKTLWHGTRKFNVLSILKNGFLLPKTLSTMQTTGAMFGNGVYFTDQSTKALNYSYGGVWDSGPRDDNCFTFLADVALGKSFVPGGRGYNRYPMSGYDSTFAKSGVSGVINNEMIVYRTTQVNIRYLVEFKKV
jgi:poly [ADP-ribose] polymerase 2/3/4